MKKTRLFPYLTVLSLSLLLLAGCEGLFNNGDPIGGCEMTVKVDGSDFCGDGVFTKDAETGLLTIQAYTENSEESIQIMIEQGAVGTFEVGMDLVNQATYTGNLKIYLASEGTVEVTRLTETRCEGKFSFTANEISGSGVKKITNGKFEIDKFVN